jgi:SAM-dependent methyltransferase
MRGDWSKTKGGRNPQLPRRHHRYDGDCSKTKGGRNPQRRCVRRDGAAHCSKTKGGRNPQRAPLNRDLRFDCNKTKGGRNPQPVDWMEVRNSDCSKTKGEAKNSFMKFLASRIASLVSGLTTRRGSSAVIDRRIKCFGYQMARQLAAQRPITKGELTSLPVTSKATRQADVESQWFAYWCAQLGIPVTYHRKIWEYCFVLQTLHDENLLVPGKRGLGFACGQEPIPSFLASRGVFVTATDLAPEHAAGKGWIETGQHGSSIDKIWHSHIVAREAFDRLVSLQFADMNAIPPSLAGYDFCWSICSLEHLGSIAKGLDFIENSLAALRPGGVAIHTTEYNIDDEGPTIDNGPTVMFQRKHIESIAERLTRKGHYVAPLDFDVGDGPMDKFIDLPPYGSDSQAEGPDGTKHFAHLKLTIDGFACTCFGLTIRKKA